MPLQLPTVLPVLPIKQLRRPPAPKMLRLRPEPLHRENLLLRTRLPQLRPMQALLHSPQLSPKAKHLRRMPVQPRPQRVKEVPQTKRQRRLTLPTRLHRASPQRVSVLQRLKPLLKQLHKAQKLPNRVPVMLLLPPPLLPQKLQTLSLKRQGKAASLMVLQEKMEPPFFTAPPLPVPLLAACTALIFPLSKQTAERSLQGILFYLLSATSIVSKQTSVHMLMQFAYSAALA